MAKQMLTLVQQLVAGNTLLGALLLGQKHTPHATYRPFLGKCGSL